LEQVGVSGKGPREAALLIIEAKGVGEEVRGRLSGHGFSTERREERRRMRSEFPRWGNERADESHTRASAEFRSAEKNVEGTALRT